VPSTAALSSVGASVETREKLGISSYSVFAVEAGHVRVYALDDAANVRGLFDVSRLNDAGAIVPELDRTTQVSYDVQYPSVGARIVVPGSDSVLKDSLDKGSAAASIVEAFSADIANVAAENASLQSTPTSDPQYLACMTNTKCYGVVLWCKDVCCNAYDEIRRQWVECTTISQYPCGACFGFPW
jgi:hypothetical protein